MNEKVVGKITEVAGQIALAAGIEIVDVELLGAGASRLLRISIDKPEGVSHGDCELISHQVGAALDEQDVLQGGPYQLEVSSPGVERKLSKPRDFERFAGQKAKIVLHQPVQGRKTWEGTLSGCEDGLISILAASGEAVSFDLKQVAKANLKFEW